MVVAGRLADSVTEQFRSSFITGFLNIHKGVIPALITGLLILEITILGLMMMLYIMKKKFGGSFLLSITPDYFR